jgi:peroxiredoxin
MDIDWLVLSTDSTDSLRSMRDRRSLSFRIFSDPDGLISQAYGCIWSKEGSFAEPAVFLINKEGLLLYQCLVSTANGLAEPGEILEHLIDRIDRGEL